VVITTQIRLNVVSARKIVNPDISRVLSIATPINRALSVATKHEMMAIRDQLLRICADNDERQPSFNQNVLLGALVKDIDRPSFGNCFFKFLITCLGYLIAQ